MISYTEIMGNNTHSTEFKRIGGLEDPKSDRAAAYQSTANFAVDVILEGVARGLDWRTFPLKKPAWRYRRGKSLLSVE